MTPVPFRGKRNDPTRIVLTLEKLAALKDVDPETLSETLYENSFKAFSIS
jgi:TatD DNase family protein